MRAPDKVRREFYYQPMLQISAQTWNGWLLEARCSAAVTWSRRRWKRLSTWSWAERNRCAWLADLNRFIRRSRRRVGWCEFSAMLCCDAQCHA